MTTKGPTSGMSHNKLIIPDRFMSCHRFDETAMRVQPKTNSHEQKTMALITLVLCASGGPDPQTKRTAENITAEKKAMIPSAHQNCTRLMRPSNENNILKIPISLSIVGHDSLPFQAHKVIRSAFVSTREIRGHSKSKKPKCGSISAFKKNWRQPTLAESIKPLPSARLCLTAVFGMGTGRTTALWPPRNQRSQIRCQKRQLNDHCKRTSAGRATIL